MTTKKSCFLFFWLPSTCGSPPLSTPNLLIVPLRFPLLSLSFPSLATSISSFTPDQSAAALHLQNALSSDLTLAFKHFLIVRLMCILLFLWCLAYGVFYSLAVNPYSILWLLAVMLLWAALCRVVMSHMGRAVQDYEDCFKARLAMLSASLLRSDVVVSAGMGLYWLEVGAASDVTAVELAIVPNKE